jgi:hypothetical protein
MIKSSGDIRNAWEWQRMAVSSASLKRTQPLEDLEIDETITTYVSSKYLNI